MKPYIIRAIYQWCIDTNYSSYLLVDATVDKTIVPRHMVYDGKIVLNISPRSVMNLSLQNDCIEFDASFSSQKYSIEIPMKAVIAIYAKETGQGMVFDTEFDKEEHIEEQKAPSNPPKLTVVK